jgi:hypothetical protein
VHAYTGGAINDAGMLDLDGGETVGYSLVTLAMAAAPWADVYQAQRILFGVGQRYCSGGL